MPDNKYPSSEGLTPYTAEKFLNTAQLPDPPDLSNLAEPLTPPRRRPGAPKKLVKERLAQLLKAIAEINSKNPYCTSDLSIAGRLKRRPEYCHLSERQLRRNVKDTVDWTIRVMKKPPFDVRHKELRISSPSTLTSKQLRQKAFEFLRYELLRDELMAKKH
jgi:hypothetical protein